jgi:hypothetical protein
MSRMLIPWNEEHRSIPSVIRERLLLPSFDDLERWYYQGFDARDIEGRSGINMHAWWTLPTGEILDVT